MAVKTRNSDEREDLLYEIEDALWSYDPVRNRDLPLDVDLLDEGRVRLEGYAPTRTIKEGVLEIVSSVRGVRDVIDGVYADPDLELAVAQALTSDSRTRHIPPGSVQLFAQLGEVVVVGRLAKDSDRPAVTSVAREVEGVRRVVDRTTG